MFLLIVDIRLVHWAVTSWLKGGTVLVIDRRWVFGSQKRRHVLSLMKLGKRFSGAVDRDIDIHSTMPCETQVESSEDSLASPKMIQVKSDRLY